MEVLTEKDKELIRKAERLHWADWYEADFLAEKADTEAARERLRRIATTLYHAEEASIGNI